MLRRSTKIQLILFVVITLLGVSYVAAEYVGLGRYIAGGGCTINADFPDSGGIFSNAEVTYRGVTVGRVGALKLIPGGVEVALNLDSCDSPKIPSNTAAKVADRSVIGEQYVDLIPQNGNGPYLGAGAVIPMSRNSIPVSTQELLVNLDKLVTSVPLNDLRTTVAELGKAFAGRGNDLGRLLDATDTLLSAANQPDNFLATTELLQQSTTVLNTQLAEQQPLSVWTHNLNLLSQQLKASNGDIQHLFSTGPSDLGTITSFVSDNRTDLGVTLARLADIGNVLVQHLPGIEQILELYPALAAGGPSSVVDYNGQTFGSLGLIIQESPTPVPQDCGLGAKPGESGQGYNGTVIRGPEATQPVPDNVAAHCTAPSTGKDATNIRGSANVPGGDPISASGGGVAYPRVTTQNTLRIGPALPTTAQLGDGSWLGMLTAGLH